MASSRNNLSTEAFEAAARDNLSRLIPSGSRIAVALSGGLDSCVLLALTAVHAKNLDCILTAIHIHHGISQNADAWAAFCTDLCASLNIPLQIERIDVPRQTDDGLESAARHLRYQVFDALEVHHVLLAHHANDQAETVLMNLLRGAGVRGAAGMTAMSGMGRYVRPLLDFPRTTLLQYAQERGLKWIEDESNGDQAFTRNYLRLEVMPRLEQRFPAAAMRLTASAAHFAEAQELLDQLAHEDLKGNPAVFPLPIMVFSNLPATRRANLLRYLLTLNGIQPPPAVRLHEAIRQFVEAAPDRHPHLEFGGVRLTRKKGLLHCCVT